MTLEELMKTSKVPRATAQRAVETLRQEGCSGEWARVKGAAYTGIFERDLFVPNPNHRRAERNCWKVSTGSD